jgi:membrane protein YdbS with pleckstrin-like domain
MMSRTIKKTIPEGEEIKKYFSISGIYINLRIIVSIIKWLAILTGLVFLLFIINRAQLFATPKMQSFETDNYIGAEFTSESDIQKTNFEFIESSLSSINISSQTLSGDIITLIKILILIFVFIILPIIIIYNAWYIKISNEFILTDKRLIVKRGWLNTHIKTIYYNRITDMSIRQTLLEKIIKTGTLSISTAGSDGYEATLLHIKSPYKIKKILYEAKLNYEKKSNKEEKNNGAE